MKQFCLNGRKNSQICGMQIATQVTRATSTQMLLFRLLQLFLLAVLPFVMLIRIAVWLHEQYQVYAWVSVFLRQSSRRRFCLATFFILEIIL